MPQIANYPSGCKYVNLAITLFSSKKCDQISKLLQCIQIRTNYVNPTIRETNFLTRDGGNCHKGAHFPSVTRYEDAQETHQRASTCGQWRRRLCTDSEPFVRRVRVVITVVAFVAASLVPASVAMVFEPQRGHGIRGFERR